MSNFEQYGKYYDLLYKDKNYKAESDYVIKKIRQFVPHAASILELGSGSGSHAQYFCENGFKVAGIERSPEMATLSQDKNIEGFTSFVGDITDTTIDGEFDVAISLFHVVSYLTDNESLVQCLKNTHRHLKPGGIFLFDVWYSPAVYFQRPETRIKRLENDEIEITRIAESAMITEQNVVNVNFEVIIKDKNSATVHTLTELHPMRHFSIPEIELLAKLADFEMICAEEFLSSKSPSGDTWGVCFILKKN